MFIQLFSRGGMWARALLVSLIGLIILAASGAQVHSKLLSCFFLLRQDLPVIILAVVMLLGLHLWTVSRGSEVPTVAWVMPRPAIVLGTAILAILLLCTIGRSVIMHDYALSRDEQMALFDAQILAGWQLAVPLPLPWHGLLKALNDQFYLGLGETALVSGYRPINAIAHAAMLKLGHVELASPIFTAIGLIATWRVASRLWPGDGELACVAVLLYLTSAQVWAVGMTSYAMAGHLALNMVWLCLFLRGDGWGTAGAIVTAFLAMGLHQVAFHPLFAAPFLALLVVERRWKTAFLYGLSYVLFFLLWSAYSHIIMASVGGAVPDAVSAGSYMHDSISTRLVSAGDNPWITAANLTRFFAWQNLLLLPLMVVGGWQAWKSRNWVMMAMVAAFLLTPAVKLILFPAQGFGWGYRYAHGLIGIACLLGAYGWSELRRRHQLDRRHMMIGTAVTVCIALPWLLFQASQFAGGYARVAEYVASRPTTMVVVDTGAAHYADDLVINRADLTNRPVRILADAVGKKEARQMCRLGTISFVAGDRLQPIASLYGRDAGPTSEHLRAHQLLQAICPEQLR